MVVIPSADRIEEYKAATKEQYPVLENVWATMDGLKLPIQQASTTQQQALFYNGWKHGHFVTAVMCFCPDGTIPIAHMNCERWMIARLQIAEIFIQNYKLCKTMIQVLESVLTLLLE